MMSTKAPRPTERSTARRIFRIGLALLLGGLCAGPVWGRRILPGQSLPAFTLQDGQGQPVPYEPNQAEPWVLVLCRPDAEELDRLIDELDDMARQVRADATGAFRVAVVLSGPNDLDAAAAVRGHERSELLLLIDPGYHLWGKLGIVASPTVVVADATGTVRWVRPGRGFDLVAATKAELLAVLSGTEADLVGDHVEVKTLRNDTVAAKQARHLQMAGRLKAMGNIQAARATLRTAYALDPNNPAVGLELAELLCRSDDAQEALGVLQGLAVSGGPAQWRRDALLGWAHRLLGQTDTAKAVLEPIAPKVPLAAYQLARIYEDEGRVAEALGLYRRALAGLLGLAGQTDSSQER